MKPAEKQQTYVEIFGRMVPADDISPRRRLLEIAACVALSVVTTLVLRWAML